MPAESPTRATIGDSVSEQLHGWRRRRSVMLPQHRPGRFAMKQTERRCRAARMPGSAY